MGQSSTTEQSSGLPSQTEAPSPDYTYVNTQARIAVYDDFRSAPKIVEISPAPTQDYINNLSTAIYEQAKAAQGSIPYTIIREVAENFIHAQFKEIVVSIYDGGNTIRFADQGPGIAYKEQAQLPGFSSATEPMKQYIRGVGSGLPIVKEYIELSRGNISIEDNMGTGSVVTISMKSADGTDGQTNADTRNAVIHENISRADDANRSYISGTAAQYAGVSAPYGASEREYSIPQSQGANSFLPNANDPLSATSRYAAYEAARLHITIANLTQRERDFLTLLLHEDSLGVTDLSKLTDTAVSSTHHTLKSLEEADLVERMPNTKRTLTALGKDVAVNLETNS